MSGPSLRRLSASARVLLAMTAVLAATVIVLVTVAYAVTARALRSEVDDTLRRETEAYLAAMRSAPAEEDLATATRAYLEGRDTGRDRRNVVLALELSGGRAIANSEVRVEDAPGTPGPGELTEARFSSVSVDSLRFRVLSTPVVGENGVQLAVFSAALAERPVRLTADRVAYTLSAAGLVAIAFGLPLSYLATRRALRPLSRIARDVAAITHAEPGNRVTYEGPPDELGALASSLNDMLDRLEKAYSDQRRFIADASHELRTPVAVIRGNVELLRSGAATGADADESLEMIEAESVRMSRLLDELLALARFDAGAKPALQPLEVRTLLEEVAARSRALAERAYEVDGACDLWISGDPDLLERALANLVRNAIRHTEEGGRIQLSCAPLDEWVRISVTDDGPGIAEESLGRVFDRFFRAPATRDEVESAGAGLGLAITRRIVELHDGTIAAENVEPHGARFTISLAAAATPSEAPEGRPHDA